MDTLSKIQVLTVIALPVLFAITVHEAAHGWMASRLGDGTAKMLGRVTLNPLKHVDLVGTLIVPLATFLLTGFLFGWAKPVPINARNLRHTRRDIALVALAGPAANLVMAVIWALAVKIGASLMPVSMWIGFPLAMMGAAGVLINVILMVLNLFPLLPLDGGRVLNSLLPPAWSTNYSRLEPYGLMILVLFLVSGLLGAILHPAMDVVLGLMPYSGVVKEFLLMF